MSYIYKCVWFTIIALLLYIIAIVIANINVDNIVLNTCVYICLILMCIYMHILDNVLLYI